MVELKKCPFCGGEAELEREWVDGFYQKYYSCVHVVCQKCYATIGRTYDDKDRSKGYAIKVWNNRANEAEIRAKAYDRFLTEMLNEFDSRYADIEEHTGSYVVSRLHAVAEQLKEE